MAIDDVDGGSQLPESLRVGVLGPVRAWLSDRELPPGPPRQQAVLGMLAMRADRVVSRDELVDAVWGQQAPASAEGGVHTYVAGLRRLLEPGRSRRGPSQVLATAGTGYVLRLNPEKVDAIVFERGLQLGRRMRAAGDLSQTIAALEAALADEQIGVVGPYGLVTEDLREFREAAGPDVDAIEGYLMAFRRALLPEIGWIDEKFRFYRLMDIYLSFFFKTAGYRAVVTPLVAERVEKHPHREWYSLSEDERATKSKKNYDIFRDRWHHGESLLAANYDPQHRWFGHDHPQHLEGTHTHALGELPPPGTMHTHSHQHWPDHSHEHPHEHDANA